MNTQIRTYLRHALTVIAMICALVCLALSSFWLGRLSGALAPASRIMERPMCVVREVDLRDAPTGYVIGYVPEGSMVWFMKLDLPFAYVAYYQDGTWLSGSITASALDVCGR